MRTRGSDSGLQRVWRGGLVFAGAVAATLLFLLVLPLTQVIGQPPAADTLVRSVDTANLPPPPPPDLEPEPEKEPEPKAPELKEAAPPLDLAQLEVALDPGAGGGSGGWTAADFGVKLVTLASSTGGDVDTLFSLSDLDQKPRVLYQPSPVLDANLRKKAPGSVVVVFIVDPSGRVEKPTVQSSSDPALEGPALAAVKQWKFEPGKRNGQAVRFRMRVPISFPQG